MTHWQQRTKRRIGWDGNLLRRKVDQAESLVIVALVALLLVAGGSFRRSGRELGRAPRAAGRTRLVFVIAPSAARWPLP